MLCGSNWAWAMYPGLSHGAMRTIEHHGTEQQKQKFLTKLISGVWTGTMCLTESHAGSDLGLIRTKAEPNPTVATPLQVKRFLSRRVSMIFLKILFILF